MNFVQKAVENGGSLSPLVIQDGYYKNIGYMNPSVFIDDDGDILVILRHVNYVLYHSENNQMFPSRWGPLSYLHPENDQHLRTVNYLCRLDSDYTIKDYALIDTSELDVEPLWEFVGQEDARLVKWNGDYYAIGVRRDTTTDGQGRMEYSKLSIDKENWIVKEIERIRIPTPNNAESYCEKNWVPILDMPYHFLKWTSPTEIVKAIPSKKIKTEQVFYKEAFRAPTDQRGSSQVIKWGSIYIAIMHDVDLFKSYYGQKDGIYRHRLAVWNENFELIGLSNQFSFLDARVEFCAGMAKHGENVLITFGFQDNAAFLLKCPNALINELIQEALYNAR